MVEIIFNQAEVGVVTPVPELVFDTFTIDVPLASFTLVDPATLSLRLNDERVLIDQPLPPGLFEIDGVAAVAQDVVRTLVPPTVRDLPTLRDFIQTEVIRRLPDNIPTPADIAATARRTAEDVVDGAAQTGEEILDRAVDRVFRALPSDLRGIDNVSRFIQRQIADSVPGSVRSVTDFEGFVRGLAQDVVETTVSGFESTLNGLQDDVDRILSTEITELDSISGFVESQLSRVLPEDFVSNPAGFVFWTFIDQLKQNVSIPVAQALRDVVEGFFELLVDDKTAEKARQTRREFQDDE